MLLKVHAELCPSIWSGDKLKPEIAAKLTRIAEAFISYLGVEALPEDVVLTGSLANFNYTDLSDVDLHVIFDFEKEGWLKNPLLEKAMRELFTAKKSVWNTEHHIFVGGHPVELYAQDSSEAHTATGLYSVMYKKWLHEPSHDIPVVDYRLVREKAAAWKEVIDTALLDGNTTALAAAKEKIKNMRRESLHDGGEYSIGNLAFKILRRQGYLDKLFKGFTSAFDAALTA
jgi:predicted nucleotidyltransferase